MSGRLEEIPGEEAFPAYLESVIASFYERGGVVKLNNGSTGSVTIGGTVSPAGGNFEEPVTQSTLKVVGAFHGLSRARSDARRFPAIDPLESWSKYPSIVDAAELEVARAVLREGSEVGQMMKVVGEEGTSNDDFITFLKAEYLDSVYLQQNAFDEVDSTTPVDRQKHVFGFISRLMKLKMKFSDKDVARAFFQTLTQNTRDWNQIAFDSDEFKKIEEQLDHQIAEVTDYA
jgi:V/A-type H+/Na+-transporting ATPase subunit A